MFTIIVCSIRPECVETLQKNIKETIGVPFEFIVYDNRNTGKGICQVYNECAAKAKYDNLCFIHEDVEFMTEDWGLIIARKLMEKDCGVIGFAGGLMKSRTFSGWLSTRKGGIRANYVQHINGVDVTYTENPYNEVFSQVITLDGLCLFSSKEHALAIGFDNVALKKFHCYDVDYTLACHIAGLKNYVCNSVLVKHLSCGNYDQTWYEENVKFHQKWRRKLPQYVSPEPFLRRLYLEFRTEKEWNEMMYGIGLYKGLKLSFVLKYFLTHPFNIRAYRYINKYIRYSIRKTD